jgi:glycosyltransferase involved in cell wall biosynthesis
MLNELPQLDGWLKFAFEISDGGGVLIVDGGSTDGTIEYARDHGAVVVVDNIIQREGYGPARNHLRQMVSEHFPEAIWMAYFDADERIDESEYHRLRWIKDYLLDEYDVIAFPRMDWVDKDRSMSVNNLMINPDWQARMTRLDRPIQYVRKLHEQITGHNKMYLSITTPKINHFHRATGQEKRDFIGKVCAMLHKNDTEYGHTVPEHPKEAMYFEMFLKEGLN